MGMSSGGGKKGAVQSEINVTPLIDVLLVLLIIFLVMMPTLLNNEKLTVPRQLDDSTEQPDPDQLFLSVKLQADQTVIWNDGSGPDETFNFTELKGRLIPKIAEFKPGKQKVVFVDFADGVKWNDVVSTMDTIHGLATADLKVALTICKDDLRKPTGCDKPQ